MKIKVVVQRTDCKKHNVDYLMPCWKIPGDKGYHWGICNDRAFRAGFIGTVSQQSTKLKSNRG